MRKIILLLVIILLGCGQEGKRYTTLSKKCVVDSVYEQPKSTIEIDRRYTIVTECGEYPITTNRLRIKKGDTIIIPVDNKK
jgi:hypothetical protein